MNILKGSPTLLENIQHVNKLDDFLDSFQDIIMILIDKQEIQNSIQAIQSFTRTFGSGVEKLTQNQFVKNIIGLTNGDKNNN